MIVVADTSPITALLHLRLIRILPQLYGGVYIPYSVKAELETLITFGYDISFLSETDRFILRSAADKTKVLEFENQLDAGEAEAISLAIELKAELLLIDERLGKQIAQAAGLICKGVVGVLIEAKNKDLVKQVRPLLDELKHSLKFRLSEDVYRLALKKAGEL